MNSGVPKNLEMESGEEEYFFFHFLFEVSNDLSCSVSVHVTMAMTAGTTTSFPMSNHTRERVTVAKLTLENFYSNLIIQHEERETRYCLCFLSPLCSFSCCLFRGTSVPRDGTGRGSFSECDGREWIPRGHRLSLGETCEHPSHWVVKEIRFWCFHAVHLLISYFVETALCRVLFFSTCEVSPSLWGWGPLIALRVPQGMSSAEQLRGGSLVWGKAVACGVCCCSAPWSSCQGSQTLQEGVCKRQGTGLRGVSWGKGRRQRAVVEISGSREMRGWWWRVWEFSGGQEDFWR